MIYTMKLELNKNVLMRLLIAVGLFLNVAYAQWLQVGNPTGGYGINTFAVNGSNLYSGTNGGGVFVSTNSGSTWSAMNNSLSNLNIKALYYNNFLYAGTNGKGVFMYNGAWGQVGDATLNNGYVYAITSFRGSNYIYVGTNRGPYRSISNGAWGVIQGGLGRQGGSSGYETITALATNSNYMFAGTGLYNADGEYWISSGTGDSWTRISDGNLASDVTCIQPSAAQWPVFAGSAQNGIYKIGGAYDSWHTVNTGLSGLNRYINCLCVISSQIIAGTANGCVLSYNNGSSWTVINSGLPANTNITALANDGTYLYAGTSMGTIWQMALSAMVAPAGPTTISPASGSAGISTSPTFSWNTSSGMDSYTLQVSTTSDFFSLVINQTGLTATSYSASGLSNYTVYYWRVNGVNAFGSTPSSTNNFTTVVAAPILLLPSNVTSNAPLNQMVSWYVVTGSTSYRLQVSTDSTFSTTFFDQSSLTSNSYQLSGLSKTATYYWRINASNSDGTSTWSAVWHFWTIIDIPVLSSPNTGSTGVPVNQTLNWGAVAGATSYSLQASTDSSGFTSPIINQSGLTSTTYNITGLSNNTKYYWRVNAASGGGTGSWSTVWSLTTIISAPVLASPSTGSAGVVITPTLNWGEVTSATSYSLQVSTDSANFTSPVVNQIGLTVLTYKVTSGLLNNTKYYWRVNATNADGTGVWSLAWNFTTIADVPVAPVLSSPNNAAVAVIVNPTLSWGAVIGATSYLLQVSTDSANFTSPVVNQTGLSTTIFNATGLANNTKYFWRVNAANVGGTGDWSTVWSFTTTIAVPTLSFPSTNSIGIAVTPTLSWGAVTGAASYSLQVSTDSANFNSPVINQTGITTTTYNASSLVNNIKYFWRVNASNAGGTSSWSAAWSFTTIVAAPFAPILNSPSIGSSGVTTTPILSWGAVAGAATYTLQMSTDSINFTTPIVNQIKLAATVYNVSGLAKNTKYFWRVNATNAGGTSAWSSVWNITTIVVVSSVPGLLTPNNSATGISLNPALRWSQAVGAISYRIQVSTALNFSSIFRDTSGVTDTSLALSGLTNSIVYYWRVDATNSGGSSAWSTVWSFTTMPPAPISPILSSPSNSSVNIALSPTLTWDAAAGATTYRIQVSTDAGFTTTVVDDSTFTSTFKAIGLLTSNTKYYWHVNAKNLGGTSLWSAVWNFSTVPPIAITPLQISPTNGSANITISPNLLWNVSTSAVSYRVQVSANYGFSSIVVDDSTLATTSRAVGSLTSNTTYYWRLNSKNPGGTSAWSTVWSFTTVIALPTQVSLLSPADTAKIPADSCQLIWHLATPLVTKYMLQVATDSAMSNLFIQDSTITDTLKYLKQLSRTVTYWWCVKAYNAAGWGPFSTKNRFIYPAAVGVFPKKFELVSFGCGNSMTMLKYALPEQCFVSVQYFDIRGRAMGSFVNQIQGPGYFSLSLPIFSWSKGTYIQIFKAGNIVRKNRITTLK